MSVGNDQQCREIDTMDDQVTSSSALTIEASNFKVYRTTHAMCLSYKIASLNLRWEVLSNTPVTLPLKLAPSPESDPLDEECVKCYGLVLIHWNCVGCVNSGQSQSSTNALR